MKKKTDTKSAGVRSDANRTPAPAPRGLLELQAECARLVPVEISLPGRHLSIPVRLLTPAEAGELELLLAEAHPPTVEREGRIEFDRSNPDYLNKVGRLQRVARALALWWACPDFEQGFNERHGATAARPGRDEIVRFVEGFLSEPILDTLYQVARSEGLKYGIAERVNFM